MKIASLVLVLISVSIMIHAQPGSDMKKEYKLKITVGETVVWATLEDNPTSRDFIKLLPFTIDMRDYKNTEKIFDPPKKLSTNGAPSGTNPDVGDITYYAPWGNIAIFYKDFPYSNGLIKLGKIEGPIDFLKVSGVLNAKIELYENEKR